MVWRKRRKKDVKKSRYSFSNILRKKGMSDERFEIMLNNLHLEDIIALKLELSSKNAGFHLYGIPVWQSINKMVKEAIFKFASTVCTSPAEMCAFLNVNYLTFRNLKKEFMKEQKKNEKSSSS